MRYTLVSTGNVSRFMDAVKSLEPRLVDSEIMGLGLVYGEPGLGKTMALDAYHARSAKAGRVRTVRVRAMAHWSESSMLKALLRALGHEPQAYRKDLMFDQLCDALQSNPAIFLIDEIDAIAGSRTMLAILKDIHDVTGSAILMVGEERVDSLLRRFKSFYNRVNQSALVQVREHTEDDVAAVVEQRCEVGVDRAVIHEIYRETSGKSMRSVLDRIRDIEAFARTNQLQVVMLQDYRKIVNGRKGTSKVAFVPPQQEPRPEAVNA